MLLLKLILAGFAVLSFLLALWQWWVGWRWERTAGRWLSEFKVRGSRFKVQGSGFRVQGSSVESVAGLPGATLLKPLKGADGASEDCLRSWLNQDYAGAIQVLFAVAGWETSNQYSVSSDQSTPCCDQVSVGRAAPASMIQGSVSGIQNPESSIQYPSSDPACEVVDRLLGEFPDVDARLVVCGPLAGANSKVSKLAQLEPLAKHDILIISDADVRVPEDLVSNIVAVFGKDERDKRDQKETTDYGLRTTDSSIRGSPKLVTCFYRLANPSTLAMQWEAVAINSDFWSQVLQGISLKPLDFALGAVMAVRREAVQEIGGFGKLANCLADDYQLGHRIAQRGHRLAICPTVVECWSEPMNWVGVWKHQLRWARTIRVCQPVPYFFSILGNGTLWPLLWLAASRSWPALITMIAFLLFRICSAFDLQRRLKGVDGRWKMEDKRGRSAAHEPDLEAGPLIPALSPAVGERENHGPVVLQSGVQVANACSKDVEAFEELEKRQSAGQCAGRSAGMASAPQQTISPLSAPISFLRHAWLVALKDLLQAVLWLLAFVGNHIEWRGQKFRVKPDGTLLKT